MADSPTARSLRECRDRGWLAEVVERWIPQSRRRHDLFGCIDLVVLDGSPGVLGIQATSGANVAARVTKIRQMVDELGMPHIWLARGNRIEVWGWRKLAKPVPGTRRRWDLRVVEVHLDG